MIWIGIVTTRGGDHTTNSYPMRGVPRVGNLINMLPGATVLDGSNLVRVTAVRWQIPTQPVEALIPEISDDGKELEPRLTEDDLPDVTVWADPVNEAPGTR
jgi:hypothetical protein